MERRRRGLPTSGRAISAPCGGRLRLSACSELLVLPFALLPVLADQRDFAASTAFGPAPAGIKRGGNHRLLCPPGLSLCGDRSLRRELDEHLRNSDHCLELRRGQPGAGRLLGGLVAGPGDRPRRCWRFLTELRLYRASVIATIAGISLLLAAHNPPVLLAGSALTGLALAPLFPLILSLFLGEIGGSRNAGWVFAVAGLGEPCSPG